MIQGASSGVGLMGLQIAKLMGAKLVIGSSTNEARRARLKDFGADLALDTRDAAWPDAVLAATGGKGVDLVVDMLSGPVVVQTMKATAILGRIVNVGRLAGMKAEFDFDLHALRRIDYIGVTFRTRTLEEVREISRRTRTDLWDAVTAGKLSLPIDRRFPLDEAVAAQAHMRENRRALCLHPAGLGMIDADISNSSYDAADGVRVSMSVRPLRSHRRMRAAGESRRYRRFLPGEDGDRGSELERRRRLRHARARGRALHGQAPARQSGVYRPKHARCRWDRGHQFSLQQC